MSLGLRGSAELQTFLKERISKMPLAKAALAALRGTPSARKIAVTNARKSRRAVKKIPAMKGFAPALKTRNDLVRSGIRKDLKRKR